MVLGTPEYSVQGVRSADASTSPAGWILHHRRAPASLAHHFEPDVAVTGTALLGHRVLQSLIPIVPRPFLGDHYEVTTLTSPDGECVFSPGSGGFRTYDPKRNGPKVAVIGDSLVAQSELCRLFAPGGGCGVGLSNRLRLDGQRPWSVHGPGQTFYSWLDVVRERATTRPDRIVLALGTNDARWIVDAPQAERELRRWATVRALYAAVTSIHDANAASCVVLVTVAAKDVANPAVAAEVARVNAMLRGAASSPSMPNVVAADFAAAVDTQCAGWQTTPTQTCPLLGADHVHLTGAGDDVRDALIVTATRACGHV